MDFFILLSDLPASFYLRKQIDSRVLESLYFFLFFIFLCFFIIWSSFTRYLFLFVYAIYGKQRQTISVETNSIFNSSRP